MSDDNFKKYDSNDSYTAHFARLTKDADIKAFDDREIVRITFVSSSRKDAHADMWIDATATDFQADLVKHLKKGDVVSITGKLTMRKYGENQEKVSFGIDRADIIVPPSLFAELKARGFTPGAGKKGATKAAPPPKKTGPTKRAVVDVDLDAE